MIKNRWVFEDEWQTRILHRDNELQTLSRLLGPACDGDRAEDVLIYGPSGVGKTATSRWMVRRMRQQIGVLSATIECSGATRNDILHEAIEKHPTHTIAHKNQSHTVLAEKLAGIVEEPYIVILDEAEIVPDLDVLDDLLSAELVSVIAIAHDQVEWIDRLTGTVSDNFSEDSRIDFRKYHVTELVDILEPRVEHGLVGWPVRTEQLEWIADETKGVARYAIKSLLSAAELAEDRNHDRFEERDVADSFSRAQAKIRRDNLKSLPVIHLRLYELIRQRGPFSASEMKDAYNRHEADLYEGMNRDPVGWRRARDYIAKLKTYNLVTVTGSTKDTQYDVVDPGLKAPIEFKLEKAVGAN